MLAGVQHVPLPDVTFANLNCLVEAIKLSLPQEVEMVLYPNPIQHIWRLCLPNPATFGGLEDWHMTRWVSDTIGQPDDFFWYIVEVCKQSCYSLASLFDFIWPSFIFISPLLIQKSDIPLHGNAPQAHSDFSPQTQRKCMISRNWAAFYTMWFHPTPQRLAHFSMIYPSLKSLQNGSVNPTWNPTYNWRAGDDWGSCASHQCPRANDRTGKISIWSCGGHSTTGNHIHCPVYMPSDATSWPEAIQKCSSSESSSTNSPSNDQWFSPNVMWAFLAVYQTVMGDKTPDEVIHPDLVLLFVRLQGVIGFMWWIFIVEVMCIPENDT